MSGRQCFAQDIGTLSTQSFPLDLLMPQLPFKATCNRHFRGQRTLSALPIQTTSLSSLRPTKSIQNTFNLSLNAFRELYYIQMLRSTYSTKRRQSSLGIFCAKIASLQTQNRLKQYRHRLNRALIRISKFSLDFATFISTLLRAIQSQQRP